MFWFHIKSLKFVENSIGAIIALLRRIFLKQVVDFIFLLIFLVRRSPFLHLVFFRVQIMLSENEVTFCKRPLHLLLHLVLQLLIASMFLAGRVALRLIHLILCWRLVFLSLDYFLPLVVSFLLQLLQTAEVMIFDVLLFIFGEYHICQIRPIDVNRFIALGCRLQPRVVQGLLGGESLPIVDLDKSANQVFCLVGDFFTLEIEAAFENELVQLFHGVTSERYCSEEHHVQAHACTPHVSLEAPISFLPNDLRSNIRWCAALLVHFLLLGLELPGHAKVAYFDLA